MSEENGHCFELFTSVRYDPILVGASWKPQCDETYCPFLLLSYHLERLRVAVQHFQWRDKSGCTTDDPVTCQSIRRKAEELVAKEYGGGLRPLRVRFVISPTTGFRIECFPTAERAYDLFFLSTFNPTSSILPSSPFPKPTRVYLDSKSTSTSDFTLYKTTRREHYNTARERVGLKPATTDGEVILFDEEGNITEGSIRNVAFWRDDQWVSPVGGGLKGVVRRWLLEQKRIVEGVVSKEDVKTGETVLLTNGVEGCTLGIITEGRYSD